MLVDVKISRFEAFENAFSGSINNRFSSFKSLCAIPCFKISRCQDSKISRFQDVKISRCQYFELQVSVCNPVCVGVELDSCLYHQDFKIPVFQELNIWDLERGAELVSLPSRQVVWRPRDMTSVTYP